MTVRLMLDSGAFGVWNKGREIDFEAYIAFCKAHPKVTYFVNLDVIPGKPHNKASLTRSSIEDACQRGWDNYWRMVAELPRPRKIIPVYHQHDDVRWLLRYLKAGVGYIGISPANDRTTDQKLAWLKGLKRLLFQDGKPLVKTHGFAVTSYRLMQFWHWHSVDSASWKQTAAWGAIYVPRTRKGEYDYSIPPLNVGVSPMSPTRQKGQKHVESMTPLIKEQTLGYLKAIGMGMGEWSLEGVVEGYKLQKGSEEIWHKKGKTVLRPSVKGVATSFEMRARANIKFLRQLEKVMPIDHLYAAGAGMPYPVETRCTNRLLCFQDLRSDYGERMIQRHLETM